jgi:hypothetical protein
MTVLGAEPGEPGPVILDDPADRSGDTVPGLPNACMCPGWLTPLPGHLYQTPKRAQAVRRYS